MQTGVTYYLATIAGDNLNGNVNLTDDCLSISNASGGGLVATGLFCRPQPDVCGGRLTTRSHPDGDAAA
ncbi:MAG: hypothetical protein R2788_17975 [Saprospiraceae bacterium]